MQNEIVHFSYNFYKGPNPKCVRINLIIKPTSEYLTDWCEQVSAEYKKELYSDNLTDLENYISNLSMDWKEEDDRGFKQAIFSSTYPNPQRWGWTKNFPILHKIEKFGVYRFHEYCEVNPVTMGAIELLKILQKTNEETYGEFGQCSWSGVLSRTIQALDLHWD